MYFSYPLLRNKLLQNLATENKLLSHRGSGIRQWFSSVDWHRISHEAVVKGSPELLSAGGSTGSGALQRSASKKAHSHGHCHEKCLGSSALGHLCRAVGMSSQRGSWLPHKGNDPRDSEEEVMPFPIYSWKSALPPDSIWSKSLRTAHTQGERDWTQPWIWGHIFKTPHHRQVSLPGHWLLSGRKAKKTNKQTNIFWSRNAFQWAFLLLSIFFSFLF